jgi:ATP-dependent exoDNAse (exonuclease V) beta subunit
MNFTVYRSSAGSGKTFTLVKEYLALALGDREDPPRKYRHILAITFTNKAAAEMKERVVKALRELSEKDPLKITGNSKVLAGLLCAELNLPLHELSARAENVLHAILHNYSDFAIGTIDGFTHKVIRTFAHDLHLPLNFEIEMDADKMLGEAIDLLVSRIGTDEQLTRALVEFTESKTDEEKNWNIELDLVKFAANLLKEDGEAHLKKLRELTANDFFAIRSEIAKTIAVFTSGVREAAGEAFELIRTNGLGQDAFAQGKAGIYTYFRKLAGGDLSAMAPNSYVIKTIEQDKWPGGKASPAEKEKIALIKGQLAACYHRLEELRARDYPGYILCREINKKIFSLAVLNEIEKIIVQYKKENNILHISEFNRIISGIVMSQPVPFIYERLGERYNHFLLDEFQDTSLLQWQNLLPLIDNALAENNFNMLVGDGKQSIYRWRGGDVGLFAKLPEVPGAGDHPLLREREQSLKNHFRLKKLDRNYRSKKEIIALNNALFRYAAEHFLPPAHRGIYSDLAQEADPDNTGGFIAIEFLARGIEDKQREVEKRTLGLITSLRSEGYALSDIAIITRNNAEGSALASFLISSGIGVISSESLLLKNSPEVNFLVNFLHFLDEPGDRISRTAIAEYLVSSGLIPNTSLDQVLDELHERSLITGFTDLLKEHGLAVNASVFAKMPLYELCEELVRIFSLGKRAPAYIQFFLDEVLAFGLKNPNSISGFLEWWADRSAKASVVVPDALDAVNVMTIHRSKGLEFPVVLMPWANWKMDKGQDELWIDTGKKITPRLASALVPNTKALSETGFAHVHEDENGKALLDNINLLYVAMTRPSERLYITTTLPDQFRNLSRIFKGFLEEEGKWSEEQGVYTFGTPVAPKQRKRPARNNRVLTELPSRHWREKVQIRQTAAEAWDDTAAAGKRTSGILLHNALARIADHTQLAPALEAMLHEGLISEDEKVQLNASLSQLLALPQVAPFFKPGLRVRNESELILPGNESFRPDRVIIDGKQAIVIDYKTGIEQNKHHKQLKVYAGLLREMGYLDVEAYVLYTAAQKVERVSGI